MDCPVSVDPFTSEELECSGRGTCQSVELMGFHRRNHLGEPAPIDYSYHAQTNKVSANFSERFVRHIKFF